MRTMTERVRRHPAAASRVAALGLGTATMLGLVGAMTLAHQASADQPLPEAPQVPAPQIVVVVHQSDGSTTAVDAGPAAPGPSVAPAGAEPAGDVSAPADQPAPAAAPVPVVLTAQPVIVATPASATPVASTHGSR